MKLLITNESVTLTSNDMVHIASNSDLLPLLKVFAPSSFDLVESATPLSTSTNLLDKDLWKMLFSLLKENGELNLQLAAEHSLVNG